MVCDYCGDNNANYKYTETINGKKKEMILCSKCAEKFGIEDVDFNIPITFSSFLNNFFEEEEEFIPKFMESKVSKCNNCGMTYNEFLEKGKFGCEHCYDAFENKIEPILKNIHGGSNHIGKKLNGSKNEAHAKKTVANNEVNLKIDKLENELKQVIKEEKYEEAAKIRDEIKKLREE